MNINLYNYEGIAPDNTPLNGTIQIDFVGADAVAPITGAMSHDLKYFIVMSTSQKDDNDMVMQPKINNGNTDLALNGAKQSASDSAVAYADIQAIVNDYTYDLINGHSADQYGSGCKVLVPMAMMDGPP
jgi:hypothetical protein